MLKRYQQIYFFKILNSCNYIQLEKLDNQINITEYVHDIYSRANSAIFYSICPLYLKA